MNADKFDHGYETRGSLRRLLSKMNDDDPDDPETTDRLPLLHPTGKETGDIASDKVSSSNDDEVYNRDSNASWQSRAQSSSSVSSVNPMMSPALPSGGIKNLAGDKVVFRNNVVFTRDSNVSWNSCVEPSSSASSIIPMTSPALPSDGTKNLASDKVPTSNDKVSNRDSNTSWKPRTKSRTEPSSSLSSVKLLQSPASTSTRTIKPSEALSRIAAHSETVPRSTESRVSVRGLNSRAQSPSIVSPPEEDEENNSRVTPKAGLKRKRNEDLPPISDDILGPFAHELDRSKRESLRAQASVLRDESGQVCPLQMAQLFLANSTLGRKPWAELEDSERSIQKMRKETFDMARVKERQRREEADKREKEERRMANKRKYGLIRDKNKAQSDLIRDGVVRESSVRPDGK